MRTKSVRRPDAPPFRWGLALRDMPHRFFLGQRWVSETEPELGLGSIRRVAAHTVTVGFGAAQETREYSLENLPLRRVRFQVGDTLQTHDQKSLTVKALVERKGLIFYHGDQGEACETELSDSVSFNHPEQRLFSGRVDSPAVFELRVEALRHQHRRRKSKVRGFVGGRIDLIPHQLYIASEVAGRLLPRVLLADEVGLGKTIEACLILHRLILTGRAKRVLILLPESLVHQWFVELLRRFNLWFHIFDEERCAAIEAPNPDANPFLDDQLVLASLGLFTGNERRIQQAQAAGWDLLIVDEAHHLGWSPDAVSPAYATVEALGRVTPGLLLLTATPEQLGMAGHFARLRLLDPDRFYNLDEFIREAEGYREVAELAQKLQSERSLDTNDIARLARILVDPERKLKAAEVNLTDRRIRAGIITDLLDQHGTGRVMFRNTRATVSGFHRRRARLYPLGDASSPADLLGALGREFTADANPTQCSDWQPMFTGDPRIEWLIELLRTLGNDKVLLICRTRRKVEAIEAAVRGLLNVKLGVFHEGLSLIQRDRNAAWFAEDDGARMLICSEIGSEGRNFQFAHHLVMFDLPMDPELLEQRIGRLDRIGQISEIQIHVPFVAGSAHEVLAKWYEAGLNSFEQNLQGGRELFERFGARVGELAQKFHENKTTTREELAQLISETRMARSELTGRLEQGRDRLLELNSFRSDMAASLVQEIGVQDHDRILDQFMLAIFDEYSIHVEELVPRTYRLGSAGVFAESFPGLPTEGFTVTSDRRRALAREEIQFLTWDHPLVTGALDVLLGSEKGNCSFARWPDAKVAGLYLEAIYLVECLAPPPLHVDRFLPPTPIYVIVDHRGSDVGASIKPDTFAGLLRAGDIYALLELPDLREELLPGLIRKAEQIARQLIPRMIAQARHEMNVQLNGEKVRLCELQKINRSVRTEEIATLAEQHRALDQHLASARLRLEAIRMIQRGSN